MVHSVIYQTTTRNLPNDICGFCHDDLQDGSAVVAHKDPDRDRLVHHIHLSCIRQWVATQPICPHCSRQVDLDSLTPLKTKVIKLADKCLENVIKDVNAAICVYSAAYLTQQSPLMVWAEFQMGVLLSKMSYRSIFSLVPAALVLLLKEPEFRSFFMIMGMGASFSNTTEQTFFPLALLINAMLPLWLSPISRFFQGV